MQSCLTSSLGQPTVSTRVGVCMSVCVCTVCAYMSVCIRAFRGYVCTYTLYTVQVCLGTYECICACMAVCL